MKALIFAAGLGTRLRPLTDIRPKALVEVGGMTLLEIAIKRLKSIGCQDIIINVHHFADSIEAYIHQNDSFGINIQFSDERSELLDTGGGLKKAAWFLQDAPFFIYNADILTNMDLLALYHFHLAQNSLATLAVKIRPSSRQLLFDSSLRLCGWENEKTKEIKIVHPIYNPQKFAFSGIHVVSPDIFNYLPDDSVFSIIDVYLTSAKQHKIIGYQHANSFLHDVGKLDSLALANTYVAQLFPHQKN